MTREYVIRMDGREAPVRSSAELERHMVDLRARPSSDFWLVQRPSALKGFERVVYRALGLRLENDGLSVYVLTGPDGAAVVFLDEDVNEYRALNPRHDDSIEQVVFRLATGEESRHAGDEVIDREAAFNAVRYFFEHGNRPSSLKYRKSTSARDQRAATRRHDER